MDTEPPPLTDTSMKIAVVTATSVAAAGGGSDVRADRTGNPAPLNVYKSGGPVVWSE